MKKKIKTKINELNKAMVLCVIGINNVFKGIEEVSRQLNIFEATYHRTIENATKT